MPFYFKRKNKKLKDISSKPSLIETEKNNLQNLIQISDYGNLTEEKISLDFFKQIRYSIPIIHASIEKIKKLIGEFRFKCKNKAAEHFLNEFSENVKVGANMIGLMSFCRTFLDNLLMCGYAVGEIVLNNNLEIEALYNANPDKVLITSNGNPLDIKIYGKNHLEKPSSPIDHKKILFSALNPKPGEIKGESVLKSLPFVSDILLHIFDAIKKNFIRIGNVRFLVNYKPDENETDKAYALERTKALAKEWAKGINSNSTHGVYDFVTCGNVSVKSIGADINLMDCQFPVRQIEEQILAIFGIPPFMMGFNWATTERMSEQQAKIFDRELEYYRKILTPTINRIANFALRNNGFLENAQIEWNTFNFNNQIEQAQARLFNAQAQKLELENEKLKLEINEIEERID